MHLRNGDVIPLGIGKGVLTLLANDNGIRFVPKSACISARKGGSGYFDVTVPISCNSDAVALRLLGFSVADIAAGMNVIV